MRVGALRVEAAANPCKITTAHRSFREREHARQCATVACTPPSERTETVL